jgi:hypothetical protein
MVEDYGTGLGRLKCSNFQFRRRFAKLRRRELLPWCIAMGEFLGVLQRLEHEPDAINVNGSFHKKCARIESDNSVRGSGPCFVGMVWLRRPFRLSNDPMTK